MSIITKSELRTFAANSDFSTRSYFANKKINLSEAKSKSIRTVFLSHSHSDKDTIEPTVTFLKSIGVNVYVDWKDSSMPAITNAETANKIKENIKNHDRFVLLASPDAIKSNWVNWELGYGDAHKYINNIAIFPVQDYDGQWKDAEYLRIYPRVEKIREYNSILQYYVDRFYVVNPDGSKVSLQTWLIR